MKNNVNRLRFLTPAIAAAVLALPTIGVAEEPKLNEEPRLNDPAHTEQLDRYQPQHEQKSADYTAGTLRTSEFPGKIGAVHRASDIIGRKVVNSSNERIGKIHDLTADLQSGKVVFAVIEMGGVVGLGADYYAIPVSALKASGADAFTADDAQIKSSQKIADLSTWRRSLDHATVASIYQSYGQEYHEQDPMKDQQRESSWTDSRSSDNSLQREPLENKDTDRQQVRGELEDNDPRTLPDEGVAAPQSRDHWGPPRASQAAGGSDGAGIWSTTGRDVPAGSLNLQSVKELLGEDVETAADEDLGSIADFGVDMSNGKLLTAIVSSGGFLGIGDELRVIPPMALQMQDNDDNVVFQGTREQLQSAPSFKGRSWPIQNEDYVRSVYQSFDHGTSSTTTSPVPDQNTADDYQP